MDIEGWKAYNLAKWERIKDSLPGLTFSQTGANEATFLLGFFSEDFGEQRVIIGRPARVIAKVYTGEPGRALESGFVDETVIDGGENVSHAEIDRILACWKAGKRYELPKPFRR